MLYTLLRLYEQQSNHEKLIEGLAYSNSVSNRRMRSAYWDLRHMLCNGLKEQNQK